MISRLQAERYTQDQKPAWDTFVRESKNGTFLFQRDYMDYHRDRFVDHSLVIRDENARIVALLPANIDVPTATLVSHGGLTYGGFIVDERMKTVLMLQVFDTALTFCREHGIDHLRYKCIPYVFHRVPSQEDLYVLYLCKAELMSRSALTIVAMRERLPYQERRRRSVKKARGYGLRVCKSDQLVDYWALLTDVLDERYHAKPVHSVDEIALLQRRFPDEIHLFAAFDGETMVAGVVVFESLTTARAQYIAANKRGREVGALDLIFEHLLHDVFAGKAYFDFGTSHDPATGVLNGGLIEQKEGFGGRTVIQDIYQISLATWDPERIRRGVL